jgi:hypothetical protein
MFGGRGLMDLHCAYRIPVPPGTYRVIIHGCENMLLSPGLRCFAVRCEGKIRLKTIDRVARAGYAVACADRFACRVEDGILDLELVPLKDIAMISALEIVPVAQDS